MNKLGKIFVLVLLACLIPAVFAYAGFTVRPSVTEILLAENEEETGSYFVKNTGELMIEVSITLEDWMERLFRSPDELDVNEWLSLEPTKFILEPGEEKEIAFKATAPPGFSKEKVAQVFFSFEGAGNVVHRIGVILYITPFSGIEDLKAEIWALDTKIIEGEEGQQIRFLYEIRNDSAVHIRPIGRIELRHPMTKKKFREWVPETMPGIYGGRSFEWRLDFPLMGLKPNVYEAEMILDYGNLYMKEGHIMRKTISVDLSDMEVKRV